MPSCSTAEHPSGIKINFIEETHRYFSEINGREIDYVSGTTFVHKFIPEFDPTGKIAERCAIKEGLTVEALKAKWAAKRDNSCIFGTRVHETAEDTLLMNRYRNEPKNEKEEKVFAVTKNIANTFRQQLDILAVEKIVFNPFLPKPIAGTIDLLARSRKDGTILILDWKSNERIDTENKYGKFCKDPIGHVPDLNMYHYGLQLSLYQYLLKLGKYVPEDSKFKRAIIHLTESGHKIYQLPDMTSEIKDMIIYNEMKF